MRSSRDAGEVEVGEEKLPNKGAVEGVRRGHVALLTTPEYLEPNAGVSEVECREGNELEQK